MNGFINRQIGAVKDSLGPARIKEIKAAYESTVENAKIVAFRELRPWGIFFTQLNPKNVQWDWINIEQRVCTNLLYYRSNYFIIFCFTLALGLVLNPIIIISVLVVILWFIYVMLLVKGPIMVGEYEVDGNMRLAICSICAIAFFALSGALQALLFCTLFSAIICLVHMLLRARNTSVAVTPAHTDIRLAIFIALGLSSNEFIANIANNTSILEAKGATGDLENDVESGVHVEGEDVPLVRRKSNPNGGHTK